MSKIVFTVAICLAAVVLVYGQADKYPAGLNPATCPNYPHCDNTIVALYNSPAVPIPYAAASSYPAGVSPAACPNYPYCGAISPPGYFVRQYPAGIAPASCPNYPYCH